MAPKLICLMMSGWMALALVACTQKQVRKPPAAPPPAYTGPDFLIGTVESMGSIRGYQPVLVSGYGVVVGLNGTGSPDVPPGLRQWLLNEMSRMGVGRESTGTDLGRMTPAQMLASNTTAVVLVEGIIPPGATAGSTFDIRVSTLPQTQTTSLEGGRLYTTDLRINGAMLGRPTSRPMAAGRGDVFVNPFIADSDNPSAQRLDDPRVGVVLGGGTVVENPPMMLVLNQPSFTRSRAVADRINSRFPQSPEDPRAAAVAQTDQFIELNVINRFRADPTRMLELVGSLFANPTDQFNHAKALELVKVLENSANEPYRGRIAAVWEAMGNSILPLLRERYHHDSDIVRLTALEAGARLGDVQAAEHLNIYLLQGTSAQAQLAAQLLGRLLLSHPVNFRIAMMLRSALNSEDALLRMAAFDALDAVQDAAIKHRHFDRMELALVQSDRPMIYVNRQGRPRIVVFDQALGFRRPLLYTENDNQLMARLNETDNAMSVYYRRPTETRGTTEQIAPFVANLIFLLAHNPTQDNPTPGYNLPYSTVVRSLYRMQLEGHLAAPLVLQPTDLAQQIAAQQSVQTPTGRPETGPLPDIAPGSTGGLEDQGAGAPELGAVQPPPPMEEGAESPRNQTGEGTPPRGTNWGEDASEPDTAQPSPSPYVVPGTETGDNLPP